MYVSVVEEKNQSRDMFGEAGVSGLRKRGKDTYILGKERLLLPRSFRIVPVDSLFVVNTFENIQIVQSFSDDRLHC